MEAYPTLTKFLLNTINIPVDIDSAYLELAKCLVEIDEFDLYKAEYNILTEILHARYPNGLPSDSQVEELVLPRTTMEIPARTFNEEAAQLFMQHASTIKEFVYHLDQQFATLQARFITEFVENYSSYDFLAQRKAKNNFDVIKRMTDYRFPSHLTTKLNRRNEILNTIAAASTQRPVFNSRPPTWQRGTQP